MSQHKDAIMIRRYVPPMLLWCDLWVAAYLAFALVSGWIFSFNNDWGLLLDFSRDLQFLSGLFEFWLVYIIYRAIELFVRGNDSEIFGPGWREMIRRVYLNRYFPINIIHLFLVLKVLLVVHAVIKQHIPLINPTLADQALLWLDTVLHAGINPALWSVENLNLPLISSYIDQSYVSWYYVKLPVILVFFVIENQRLSQRFFFALFGIWVLGGMSAVLIPSLGPIYVWPEWFSSLEIPLARTLQARLWDGHLELLKDPTGFISYSYEGIAAFPSLHVGVVALYTFFLWELHWFWGLVGALYTAVILVGSVFLGWHYAIDGYWCILLAWFLYRMSRRIIADPK